MANEFLEVEEQEGTRIEKVLLAALVAFLLVGGFWVLGRIEGSFPAPVLLSSTAINYNLSQTDGNAVSIEDELGVTQKRRDVAKLQQIVDNRNAVLTKALALQSKAEKEYKFRREEYRTAMQSGSALTRMRTGFESSRAAYEVASALVLPAQAALDAATKQVAGEQQKLNAAQMRAQSVFDQRSFQRNLKLFAVHFTFAGACLAMSFAVWQRARKRRWRYLTVLTAVFTASVLQLLLLLLRYCWALFLQDIAVLGVSALGTIVCVLAIVGIKRWLYSPERLAQARLGSHRCARCATPFIESQNHCWKCGHALVEKCPSCGGNRLLFAPHCGNCGVGVQGSP